MRVAGREGGARWVLGLAGREREDVEGFGAAYGWDPRDWPGLATLVAIREVSGLGTYLRNAPPQPFARRELAMRITTLQAGDRSARWNRPVLERTREA